MRTSFASLIKFVAVFVALLAIAYLVGCTGSTGQPVASIPSDASGGHAKAYADLDNLSPPNDSDTEIHNLLVNALRKQIAELPSERLTATVPTGSANVIKDLRIWDNGDGSAGGRFSYICQGDYNQDSTVAVSDITPIAIYIDAVDENPDWVKSGLPDGDGNGMVTVSDITPIALGYNNIVEGYYLQTSGSEDGEWLDVAPIMFDDSTLPETGGRRQFAFDLVAPLVNNFYRVVPFYKSERGVPGIPFEYIAASSQTFSINGACTDGTGEPLGYAMVTLDGLPPVECGVDGIFEITEVPDGYSGNMSAWYPDSIFLPETWVVQINNAGISGIVFKSFAFSHLEATLPPEGSITDDVNFEIHLHDINDLPLIGFNTQATLTVSPITATVFAQPGFVDSVAYAGIRFSEPGDYAVTISGLGAEFDGVIGNITITDPQPPMISIEKWQGGAEGALSLVFDDGTKDHWDKGMELWEEYGFRVTLGILANRFQDEPARLPQLQEAFDAGHELANHTTTHPDLTTLSDTELHEEMDTCKALIIDNVNGIDSVRSVIYPYEMFDSHVMDELDGRGYFFARSGHQDDADSATPNDAYDPPYLHLYSWANLNMLDMWMWDSIPDIAISSGDWMIEQCHGIGSVGESGVGWSPRPLSDFREHYDHIASKGDALWVAPMADVGFYVIERNHAVIEVLDFSGGHLEFSVSDDLDDDIFSVPLTVTMTSPLGWDNITVRQGSTLLTVSAPFPGDLRFDVTPDGGTISVENGG